MPELHQSDGYAIHPIAGQQVGNRQLELQRWSRLTFRTCSERIPQLIAFSGKQLQVADRVIRVGIPEIRILSAASTLRSRLVTTKNGTERDRFVAELRRQLAALQVRPEVNIDSGSRSFTFRIRDKEIIGHRVIIDGLTPEESLIVQERGLGGRSHMGCGVFVPHKEQQEQ